LNSLFKVLFNFPSRYLFAIGLVAIFSLRRSSAYGPDTLCGLIAPFMETWTIRTGQTLEVLPNTTVLGAL